MAAARGKKGKTPKAGASPKKPFNDEASIFKVAVKQDAKTKNIQFKIGTGAGQYEMEKSMDDVKKFMASMNKKYGSKQLKSAQNKDMWKGNAKQVSSSIKEYMQAIAKHKDVATDGTFIKFSEASGAILDDLRSGDTYNVAKQRFDASGGSGGGSDESKSNDAASGGSSSRDMQNWQEKYKEAKLAFEKVKSEYEQYKRQRQQIEATLRHEIQTQKQQYETLEARYESMQEQFEENRNEIDDLTTRLNKKDANALEEKFPHLREQFGDYQDPDDVIQMLKEELEQKTQEVTKLRESNFQYIEEIEKLNLQTQRAQYTAKEAIGTLNEVTDAENYSRLMNDYADAEAEIDDLTQRNEKLQKELKDAAEIIRNYEKEQAANEPKLTEYPDLKQRIAKLEGEKQKFDAKLEIANKRSESYQEDLSKLRQEFKGTVSREKMEEAIKKVGREKEEILASKAESDKKIEELEKELTSARGEITDLKHDLGKIVSENEKLSAGGGKDVNLELDLDLIYGFSIFKQDEFEFGSNISREQLKLWAEHVKKLTSEIHEDFVSEIEDLSKRNDLLEEYIEANGLPSPEDSGFNALNAGGKNNLPHPVPSMSIEDLDKYNPTKNELKEYIDLMFREWRNDDNENIALMAQSGVSKEDVQLMNELKKLGGIDRSGDENEDVLAGLGGSSRTEVIPDDATEEELRKIINKKMKQMDRLRGDLEKAQLEIEENQNSMGEQYKTKLAQMEEQLRDLQQQNKRLKKAMGDNGSDDGNEDVAENEYGLGALRADQQFVSVDGADAMTDDERGGTGRRGSHDNNNDDDDDDDDGHDMPAPFSGIDGGDGVDQDDDELTARNISQGNGAGQDKMEMLEMQFKELTEYSHKLEDDIKVMIFEYDLKLSAMQREHAHEREALELRVAAANEKVMDAAALQDNDFATNFNDRLQECWEIRDGETTLKLSHIEEIRKLEREKDELLRECNHLRVRNERLEQNVDERIKRLEEEKEKLARENEHFSTIASGVSDMKEEMDRVNATREMLEQQMQDFEEEKKALRNQMKESESKLKQEVDIHKRRATDAEADLKNIIVRMHGFDGIDSSNMSEDLKALIITRSEAEEMRNDLQMKARQLTEAIKSKIKLIQTSSYEIDRLRDEIRLFSCDPTRQRKLQKYDLIPNAYNEAFDKRNRMRYRRGLRRLQHGSFGMSGAIVDEYDRKELKNGLRGHHGGNSESDFSETQSHFSIFSEVPVGTYQDLLNGNNEQEPSTAIGRAYKYTVGVLGTIGSGITGALGIEVSRKDGNNGNNNNNNNNMSNNNLNASNMAMMNASGFQGGMVPMGGAGDPMLNPMIMNNAAAAAAHQRMVSANMSVLSGMAGQPMGGMPAQHMSRASAMSFGGAPMGSVAGYSAMQGGAGMMPAGAGIAMGMGMGMPMAGTHNHSRSQLSDFVQQSAGAVSGGGSAAVNQSMLNIAQQFELAKMGMSMSMNDEEDDDGAGGMGNDPSPRMDNISNNNRVNTNGNRRHGSSNSRGGSNGGGGGMLGIARPARHARLNSRGTKLSVADIAEHNERDEHDDDDDDHNNISNVDISQPIPQRVRKKTHSRTLSTMVSHYGRAWEEVKDENENNNLNDLDDDVHSDHVNHVADLNNNNNNNNMHGGDDDDFMDDNMRKMERNTTAQNRQRSQDFWNAGFEHNSQSASPNGSASSGGDNKNTHGLNLEDVDIDVDDDELEQL